MQPEKQTFKAHELIESMKQDLQLPVYVYKNLISILENNKILNRKYEQSTKMNNFKDEMFQKVVSMFQQKQSKTLKKLKSLEEINIKYMQKYIETKKKQSKNYLPLDLSIKSPKYNPEVSRRLNNNETSFDRLQDANASQFMMEDLNQLSQTLKKQGSQSIFESNQWQEMIKKAEKKIVQIQQHSEGYSNQKINHNELIKSFLHCFTDLIHVKDSSGKKTNIYVKKIQILLEKKKQQISQNIELSKHSKLNNDLKRLRQISQRATKLQISVPSFKESFSQIPQKSLIVLLFDLLSEKNEIQNLIQAEIDQNQQIDTSREEQNINQILRLNLRDRNQNNTLFNTLCQSLITNIQLPKQEITNKLIQKLQQKKQNIESSFPSKFNSLHDYMKKLQQQTRKDKEFLQKLTIQNQKIKKQMKQLQNLKQKYLFEAQNKNKAQVESFFSQQNNNNFQQRINKIISKSGQEDEKQMIKVQLAQKDLIIKQQRQQISKGEQKLRRIVKKIELYLNQQGVTLQRDISQIDVQDMLQIFYKSTIRQVYERFPEEKSEIIKRSEEKYEKMMGCQRQQLQQRIEELRCELRHTQLQRDSYKASLNSQVKQISKLKAINEKLVNKKSELEMQSAKIQQMLKSVLQKLFAYLMSNMSYESLLEHLEMTVENIKLCLKFRERQKERDSKELPPNDYRFSGLSAVSNDYSFSKLNKQSYCDYFNEDSSIQEQSEVISKLSEEDQLPPSRPSFSHHGQKRQMSDIYQRATMAHEDESLLGYLNPVQARTPRVQFERNTVLLDGLNDESIRNLQSNLDQLKTRIPEQTIEVERQMDADTKEIYFKYKQALQSLEESQRINKNNEIQYQNFLKQLKEKGVMQSKQRIQKKLYFMQKTIQEQQKMLQEQKQQFQSTIAHQVIQSEKSISKMIQSINKSSPSNSRNK